MVLNDDDVSNPHTHVRGHAAWPDDGAEQLD
jgi:hypothetical protein